MGEIETKLAEIIEQIHTRIGDNTVKRFFNNSDNPENPLIIRELDFLREIKGKLENLKESQSLKPVAIVSPNLLPIIEMANKIPERLEDIRLVIDSTDDSDKPLDLLRKELKFLHELSKRINELKPISGQNIQQLEPQPPKQGFLLLAENGTHPPKYEHEDYYDAVKEANRLALLTKGSVHVLHKVATVRPAYQVVITTVEYKGRTQESKQETIDLLNDSDLPF